jgi:type VI secretion system secreted protein VgrG
MAGHRLCTEGSSHRHSTADREGTTLSNALTSSRLTGHGVPSLPKPAVDGPQSAIVTGPAAKKSSVMNMAVSGCVSLGPLLSGQRRQLLLDTGVQAWAGAGFGNLAIPRVGQEVIVDFLNGDPDQPIIMGSTYHQDNRSPGSLPGTKTQMTIRSKTYKGSGFNELRFEDATDKEQVYIHAQKNMDTEVLNNRTTDVKVDHTETIGTTRRLRWDSGRRSPSVRRMPPDMTGPSRSRMTSQHDGE